MQEWPEKVLDDHCTKAKVHKWEKEASFDIVVLGSISSTFHVGLSVYFGAESQLLHHGLELLSHSLPLAESSLELLFSCICIESVRKYKQVLLLITQCFLFEVLLLLIKCLPLKNVMKCCNCLTITTCYNIKYNNTYFKDLLKAVFSILERLIQWHFLNNTYIYYMLIIYILLIHWIKM